MGVADRIIGMVSIDDADDPCWEWTGYTTRSGYGRIGVDGQAMYAHRVSYSCFVGELEEGLELDHLCRNRSCCNPDHLEQVDHATNCRRGDMGRKRSETCHMGHPMSGRNLYVSNSGARACKECLRARKRIWRQKQKS